MNRRLRVAVVFATAGVLVGVGTALAAAGHSGKRATEQKAALTPGTYSIKTTLNAAAEVPKVKGVSGTGTFTGTLNVTSATKAALKWKLTYAHLSGAGLASHVHLGLPGKAGPIIVPLCAPCHSGVSGAKTVTVAAATAIIAGKAYVNVHTKAHPAGEIRGAVKGKAAAGGGASSNPYANVTVAVTPALVAKGKALSEKYSCEGCHTLTGAKSTGPTWKGLAGRKVHLTTGETVTADDPYLILAIEQPDAQIVSGYSSGVMTTAIGNIPLAEAKAIVAYIKSIK